MISARRFSGWLPRLAPPARTRKQRYAGPRSNTPKLCGAPNGKLSDGPSNFHGMPEFVPLAESIVDAVLRSNPGLASATGDHRYDDRLPDLSPGAVTERVAMLRDAADALSGVDPEAFGPEDQVDHAILSAFVERGLFELTDVREHEWNPLHHNPGPLLHALISRQFAPAEERLASLGGRLAAIPDALATARAVLRDVPRIHAETAIGQFAGAAVLIRDQMPTLLAQEPGLRPAIEPAAAAALDALAEFSDWLKVG